MPEAHAAVRAATLAAEARARTLRRQWAIADTFARNLAGLAYVRRPALRRNDHIACAEELTLARSSLDRKSIDRDG